MQTLPPSVLSYLQTLTLDNQSPAYLRVDGEGRLTDWGGALTVYGLDDLRRGAPVGLQAVFLENLFPLQSSPVILPAVSMGEERCADIHIFMENDNAWVVLLDVTTEETQRRRFQQKVNELSLLGAQQSRELAQLSQRSTQALLGTDIFAALNLVLLEHATNSSFRLLGSAPDWLVRLYPQAASSDEELRLGDRFPVLDNFLVDAEQFWRKERAGRLCSGLWTETDATGNERPLEASALWVDGRKILLLELLNGVYEKKQSLIQKAREHSLQYHDLESRLHKLLDQLHVGVFRTTPSGELLEANPAFARIIEASAEESLQALGLQQQSQPLQRREVKMARADGEALWVSLTTTQGLTPSGELVIDGLLEDITERKRAEEARQEEAAVVEALSRVGRELIALLDAPTILNRLCQVTTEVLGCDSSHAFLWQTEERMFVPVASHGDPPEQWEILRVMKFSPSMVADVIARLEREGVTQELTAAPRDAVVASLQRQMGVPVALYLALRRGEALIGVLSAGYRTRSEPFTARQERVARGITQLASLALQNALLVEELERANRLKDDFLAMFSHELRTPLNIILGYNDLLLGGMFGDLTTEQAEILRRVDKSAQGLTTLVAAILDLSRLEMRQLPLELHEVNLATLVEEVKTEMENQGGKEGLRFIWRVAPQLPGLRTDSLKLKIILKNLLNNAMKFTERGSITLDVHPHADGVEITVADTGVGIASDAMPIIFDAFRQADSSTTRHYGGVGLGLYIVRRLLDLLGGSITVESEVGRGSTFRIFLPTV